MFDLKFLICSVGILIDHPLRQLSLIASLPWDSKQSLAALILKNGMTKYFFIVFLIYEIAVNFSLLLHFLFSGRSTMTIVSGGQTPGSSTAAAPGPGSRSNSRNKNTLRFSSTKIRNSSSGAGSSTAGGHPMVGADPNKREIKQRFEITKKLGSGTYGKVSLAFDHKFDREVSLFVCISIFVSECFRLPLN